MIWIVFVLILWSVGVNAQPRQREGTRPDQMADLAVRALTVSPEFPEPGELVQIRLEVQNRAFARAQGAQISFFVNGQPLATHSLKFGGKAVHIVMAPWTPNGTGLHSISAVVEPKTPLFERDRLDNTAVTEVAVARRPPPAADLVVADVQTSSKPDRPTMLRVTIRNDGKVQASAPLLVRQGQARLVFLPGPVDPGKSAKIEIPWGANSYDPVNVEVNPRFKAAESRAGNNAALFDARSPVDLRVENLALHTATLQPDQPRNVTVTFRIVNDGRQNITRSFRSRIEPGNGDPFFVTTTGLAAGGIAYVSHTIRNAPARFVVTVVADVDKDISEPDEKNNTATINFKNPAPDIDRWVSIGPHRITGSAAFGIAWNDATGRLSTIAIHPTSPEIMYVAGAQTGVWKTTNGGTDWSSITDALPVRVAALALDPRDPARIFLVTPNEGVFRSEDSGTSWIMISSFPLDAMVYVSLFLINPANSNDMVLASQRGVYRSIDGGKTWLLKLDRGPATGLIRRPADPNTLYAAISHETDPDAAGLYQSFDGGDTWLLKQGCPGGSLPANDENTLIHLAVSGEQLFVSYHRKNPASFRLFRTRGEGCSFGGALDVSWQAGWSTSGSNAAKLWRELAVDPTNPRNVYLGGTFFWKSTNNGTSFTKTSGDVSPPNSAHVDHHKIITDPISPNVIYSLNDGGIFKSTNRGASSSWQFIGAGIANAEFYDLASAVTRPDLVIGGTQDNGTIRHVPGSTTWTMIRINDGASVAIDPTNPNVMYSMEQYASSIRRSTNGGATFPFNAAGGLPTGSVCERLPFQIHPRFPQTLLTCCNGLWQTSNSGSSWSTAFTPANGTTIDRSTIDGPADVYYVGSSTGVITRRSGTFIATFWRTIFSHPAGVGITDLELDRDNRAILYASFKGQNTGRIYRLVNSGGSPPVFLATDITSDLPPRFNVKTLAVDRNHPFTIYAGTHKGVYRGRSIDGGATWFWRPYMNGMPAADVHDLEVHPVTGVMRAATNGRSAYEVNTDDPVGSVITVRGRITFLRVHDVGTGFGTPNDQIDGEVIVKFDTSPLKAFGFQLRTDSNEEGHRAMLKALRDGLRRDRIVEVEYIRTGPTTGQVLRVVHVR